MEKVKKPMISVIIILALLVALTGCGLQQPAQDTNQSGSQPETEVILATTTSTYDSGLLDVLISMFEKQTGYTVTPVAVGTGAALEMGKKGDADVLLVHAPAAEMKLVESGHAINRQQVMHNDFVIVGPATDPAGIRGMAGAADALQRISQAQTPFVSRGDDSGTNKKEMALWKDAGIEPQGNWYLQSGKGMGDTLTIASEEQAYTLTDRGTYLALKQNLDLVILVEGDEILKNIYHVMQVNPEKFPDLPINGEGAKAFVEFMISPGAQHVIEDFGVAKYGQPLFFPDAL